MAWLEKRNKNYLVCHRVGRKVKRTLAYTDKSASQAMLTRLNKELALGKEGLTDPYAEHRDRPLSEHVGDWINDLRQLGRANGYVRTVEGRLERLVEECRWKLLEDIDADSFADWREKAMGEYGHNAKDKKLLKRAKEKPTPMSPKTKNHYLEAVRAFCLWCVKRGRMEANPIGELEKLDVSEDVRRGRRAITEEELGRLLAAVPERYQLLYKVALGTGLRAGELKALQWGDIHADYTTPHIRLRAATTKAKRGDSLPLRADLAKELSKARHAAADTDRVFDRVPRAREHQKWLLAADIPYADEQGRYFDIHALRHEYGTLLSKSGVAPREAMELMRHTDMRLTMNLYTDPRIFDLKAAVEKMPTILPTTPESRRQAATGTDTIIPFPDVVGTGGTSRRGKEVAQEVARIGLFGRCSAGIGDNDEDRRNRKLQDLTGKIAHWRPNAPMGFSEGDGARTRNHRIDNPVL